MRKHIAATLKRRALLVVATVVAGIQTLFIATVFYINCGSFDEPLMVPPCQPPFQATVGRVLLRTMPAFEWTSWPALGIVRALDDVLYQLSDRPHDGASAIVLIAIPTFAWTMAFALGLGLASWIRLAAVQSRRV